MSKLIQCNGVAFIADDTLHDHGNGGHEIGVMVTVHLDDLYHFKGLGIDQIKKEAIERGFAEKPSHEQYLKLQILYQYYAGEINNTGQYFYLTASPEPRQTEALWTMLMWQCECNHRISDRDFTLTSQQYTAFTNYLKHADLNKLTHVGYNGEYIGLSMNQLFIGIEKDGYTHS